MIQQIGFNGGAYGAAMMSKEIKGNANGVASVFGTALANEISKTNKATETEKVTGLTEAEKLEAFKMHSKITFQVKKVRKPLEKDPYLLLWELRKLEEIKLERSM